MPISLTPGSLARLLGEWNVGAAPAYRELADVVRLLILDGRIALDVALPSERSLAATLGISRTTVTAAYALLREQGFLSSGQGSRSRSCIPSQGPAHAGSRDGALTVERRSRAGRAGRDPGPGLRLPARQRRGGAPGLCRGTDGTPRAAAGLRLRRPGRRPAPRSHRRTVHRGRGPHDGRADPGHLRRTACPEHCAPHPGRPFGHQGARGTSELPECPRRDPGRGVPPGPRGHARRRPSRRSPQRRRPATAQAATAQAAGTSRPWNQRSCSSGPRWPTWCRTSTIPPGG